MLLRRRRAETVDDERDVIVEHGPSLAKGPALVAGLAAGRLRAGRAAEEQRLPVVLA